MVQQHGLPKDWLERDTPIAHIAFNPRQPTQLLLHDTYMLCILDKSLVSLRPATCLDKVGGQVVLRGWPLQPL